MPQTYRAPKAARAKAASAIRRNKKVGNRCMTQVGKVRAQQIAQGKPMSKEVLKRTKDYLARGFTYYNERKPLACGTIAVDGWGGRPMKKALNGKRSPI